MPVNLLPERLWGTKKDNIREARRTVLAQLATNRTRWRPCPAKRGARKRWAHFCWPSAAGGTTAGRDSPAARQPRLTSPCPSRRLQEEVRRPPFHSTQPRNILLRGPRANIRTLVSAASPPMSFRRVDPPRRRFFPRIFRASWLHDASTTTAGLTSIIQKASLFNSENFLFGWVSSNRGTSPRRLRGQQPIINRAGQPRDKIDADDPESCSGRAPQDPGANIRPAPWPTALGLWSRPHRCARDATTTGVLHSAMRGAEPTYGAEDQASR